MESSSLGWIVEEAGRLRERGAVQGKSWTLAQVCEHLALAVQGTVDAPGGTPDWWRRTSAVRRLVKRIMKHGLLIAGRFPEGVPSPDFVRPASSPNFEQAVERLRAACVAFDQKRANPGATWVFHPLLGPMSGSQWARFHAHHARHHFRFMRPDPAASPA